MKVRFGRINAALAAQKKQRIARQGAVDRARVQAPPIHHRPEARRGNSATSSCKNAASTPAATPKFAPTCSVRTVGPEALQAQVYATPPALRQTPSRRARSEQELQQLIVQSAAVAAQMAALPISGNAKEPHRPPKRSRVGLDEIRKACLVKRSRAGTVSKKKSKGRRRKTAKGMTLHNIASNQMKEPKKKGAVRRKRSRFESLSRRVDVAAALADAKNGVGLLPGAPHRKAAVATAATIATAAAAETGSSPDLAAVRITQRAVGLRAKRNRISNTPLRGQNLNLRPDALDNVEPTKLLPEAVL